MHASGAAWVMVFGAVVIGAVGVACGDDDSGPSGDGGATSDVAIALDGVVPPALPPGTPPPPATGCEAAGGVCGCAGGCNEGYHAAPSPLLDMCPQPCAECGACSQQCCLPDEPADAGMSGGCGGATCARGQQCIHPCCGGAPEPCTPAPDGGACPAGASTCTLGDGSPGCVIPCTPPPAYCADEIPVGCMLDEGSGEVLCTCA